MSTDERIWRFYLTRGGEIEIHLEGSFDPLFFLDYLSLYKHMSAYTAFKRFTRMFFHFEKFYHKKKKVYYIDILNQISIYYFTKRVSLDGLVSKITDENRHTETDFGLPVGNEIW